MISLAVISGGLDLTTGLDLSQSSISYYDRMYIRTRDKLNAIERELDQDERFSDYQAFLEYVLKNTHRTYQAEGAILSYLNTILLPDGTIRHRFAVTEKINEIDFIKPVAVVQGEGGSIELRLLGILE